MNFIHTSGVVLRHTNVNEADRMLTVFSPNLGKISILARGCRKPKSKFLSVSQLFCYSEFVLLPYRDIYIINQADIKDAYYDLRNDIEKLTYAVYLANLTEDVVNVGEGNIPLFNLLLHILTYLAYSDINPNDAALVYELKLMDIIGFRPMLDSCLICGNEPDKTVGFSFDYGGITCSNCHNQSMQTSSITMETVKMMRSILNMDLSKLSNLLVNPSVRKQLNDIMPKYIENKLDKKYKSRDYIRHLF